MVGRHASREQASAGSLNIPSPGRHLGKANAGLELGGAEGGRAALDKLWREVNQSGGRNVFGDSAIWSKTLTPDWLKDTPMWKAGETLAMSMSPYSFNPFNLNPLKRVLETAVDFEAVRAQTSS